MRTQYGTLSLERIPFMINTISVRTLRPRLSKVLDDVQRRFERYIITKHGHPEAVLMSMAEYESLVETLDIMSDKKLMAQLKKANEDLKAGKGVPLEVVHKRLGIV